MAQFSGLHAVGWHVMLDNWWDKVSLVKLQVYCRSRTLTNSGCSEASGCFTAAVASPSVGLVVFSNISIVKQAVAEETQPILGSA